MKCWNCGSEAISRTTIDHDYVESGLPGVRLLGIPAKVCAECGARRISIPAIEQLHRVLATWVLKKPARLSGAEVRFLRKFIGLSGVDFARKIGATHETVSKWENDRKAIGPQSDRLLRLLVVTMGQIQEYQISSLDLISPEPRSSEVIAVTRNSHDNWRLDTVCVG